MTTIYDVLRRPLVTEKTNYQTKLNQYSFEVMSSANRTLVKDAVERLFEVKVANVNIINTPAKRGRRRNRRLLVRRPGYKKAIVTLEAGETLSIFEGVQ
ncbi:MAG TPA: 50S ribosomal protein L23 [Anaerolineae bacterium]|jgi:large subunit ribosomal protein L23|nr:50S ribosomal protein L23 [Anaerolineae bacterium]HAE59013.1 50S ribosomal protein L23 [Anaerolineae bacterium]